MPSTTNIKKYLKKIKKCIGENWTKLYKFEYNTKEQLEQKERVEMMMKYIKVPLTIFDVLIFAGIAYNGKDVIMPYCFEFLLLTVFVTLISCAAWIKSHVMFFYSVHFFFLSTLAYTFMTVSVSEYIMSAVSFIHDSISHMLSATQPLFAIYVAGILICEVLLVRLILKHFVLSAEIVKETTQPTEEKQKLQLEENLV